MKRYFITLTAGLLSGILVSSLAFIIIDEYRKDNGISSFFKTSEEIAPSDIYKSTISSKVPAENTPLERNLNFTVSDWEYSAVADISDKFDIDNIPISYLDDTCKDIIDEIIDPDMYAYEKVKAVHDYLVRNTSCDESLNQHDAYDTLTNGLAVCTGYTDSCKAILDRVDVPCEIILSNDGTHEWNAVKLDDGNWYYLDITWDDRVMTDETGYEGNDYPDGSNMSYFYFLLPYSEMSKYQQFDSICLPEGTSTYYNELAQYSLKSDLRSDFYEIMDYEGYENVVETVPYNWELEFALKNLADSEYKYTGCVIAYYGNTKEPHYPSYITSRSGETLKVNSEKWAYNYFYMILTLEPQTPEDT